VFSFMDCALSYGLLALAESFEMVLLCRAMVGLGKVCPAAAAVTLETLIRSLL